jgi:hypothetical protein
VEDLLRLADGLLEDRAPLAHERVPLGVCQLRRRVRGFPVVLSLPAPAGEARRGRLAQEAKAGQETEKASEVYCGQTSGAAPAGRGVGGWRGFGRSGGSGLLRNIQLVRLQIRTFATGSSAEMQDMRAIERKNA